MKVTNDKGMVGQIESIDITELGYVKVRVYFESERRWISYVDAGGLESLINGCKLKLNTEASV
jgi:hypothetical protein